MDKERDRSLDAVCGLFIVYMILGHAFQWANATNDTFYIDSQYFLFMFMAWFFYKSGMFHHEQQLKVVVSKSFRRLIIPFMVYTLIGEIVLWANLYIDGTLSWKNVFIDPIMGIVFRGSCGGNYPLWFLLSLFLVKTIIALSDKYNIRKVYLLFVCLIIAGGGHNHYK